MMTWTTRTAVWMQMGAAVSFMALVLACVPMLTGFNCSFNGPSEGESPRGWDEVDQSCDFVNALDPEPGCAGGGGGTDSRCGAAPFGWHHCGYCASTPGQECRSCPDGYYCPSDPCSEYCGPRTDVYGCPSSHPVDCGDFCCADAFPVCCDDVCAESGSACDAHRGEPDGPGAFDCSPANPEVVCNPLAPCSRCTVEACGGPTGSGCAAYRTSDGRWFRASCTTSACIQSAVMDALSHCGCT